VDSTENLTITDDEFIISSNAYKSTYGKPNLIIPLSYVRAALALLIEGAIRLKAKKIVNVLTDEDPISYLLDVEMKAARRIGTSDIIRWVVQPNIQRDPEDPLLRCEPDFMFLWSKREIDPDLCIYAEAKRLFGTGPSLAGKYVEEGLLDFVEGRYGRNHNYGIMVGYVLRGPIEKAVAAIKSAMNSRKKKTLEHLSFLPDSSLCSHPYTHHSSHLQQGSTRPMILVHIFLDFS